MLFRLVTKPKPSPYHREYSGGRSSSPHPAVEKEGQAAAGVQELHNPTTLPRSSAIASLTAVVLALVVVPCAAIRITAGAVLLGLLVGARFVTTSLEEQCHNKEDAKHQNLLPHSDVGVG
eukprot:gnl/TRDRNA2_/TRDRNA2_172434_c1_seq1.p1 gnl/TRDRNA2_/TRDRNA2_172434_c1~~gnl/TRDRNA2_/TRDRNA2_172434_c1_seq1.p1  ORF type:complete len:120 (-),score=15.66 gnl/TRDRNA2_/TRDRNA2_172434_c1_seq1:71-430(-)